MVKKGELVALRSFSMQPATHGSWPELQTALTQASPLRQGARKPSAGSRDRRSPRLLSHDGPAEAKISWSTSIFGVKEFVGVDAASLFTENQGPGKPVRVSRWPLYSLWGLSLLSAGAALLNRVEVSAFAFVILTVAAFVLLLAYRMTLVRATRTVAGSGAVLGVRRIEQVTVLGVVLGSIANGVVLGLWLGGLELWFR